MLYIDDDPDALDLYKDMLAPTIEVTPCLKADEGIQLAERDQYDAIMLDIHFPGITGFDIYEAIRRTPHNRTTPVFFISSENTVQNRLKAFGLGSEDFISRHMDPEEVLIRIKSRLERKVEENPIITLGDIEIDQANLIVKVDGKLTELTQTEYRLVLLMLRETLYNPSKVFEKDEIIKFVWPLDPESVYPRTLATHLTNLRKKLNSKKVKFKAVRLTGITVIVSD